MYRICVATLLFVLALFSPLVSSAQELVIGTGTTDFGDTGMDGAILELDYRHAPFLQKRIMSVAVGANANISGEGDLFIGAGLWTRWQWDNGWFIDNSVMPGLYREGTPGNDLGSAFEIRSLLAVGYKFDNGNALSAALTHRSNASLATDNPGANTYLIRYHISF